MEAYKKLEGEHESIKADYLERERKLNRKLTELKEVSSLKGSHPNPHMVLVSPDWMQRLFTSMFHLSVVPGAGAGPSGEGPYGGDNENVHGREG